MIISFYPIIYYQVSLQYLHIIRNYMVSSNYSIFVFSENLPKENEKNRIDK